MGLRGHLQTINVIMTLTCEHPNVMATVMLIQKPVLATLHAAVAYTNIKPQTSP